MNKKLFMLFIFIFSSVLLFSSQVSDDFDLKDTEGFVNLVKVKVTLPDSNVLWAVVKEEGELKITTESERYVFVPRIFNIEEKNAAMENILSSDRIPESFHFEIIDIVKVPIKKIRDCPGGSCCLSCGGTTACSSCVAMCGSKCCCNLGCCEVL